MKYLMTWALAALFFAGCGGNAESDNAPATAPESVGIEQPPMPGIEKNNP